MINSLKPLIIGGAGLIGSHLARRFAAPIIMDDCSRGCPENIANGTFIKGTVCDLYTVTELVKDADVVFFLACMPVWSCQTSPVSARYIHVNGLANAILACQFYGKRLVYSSTGSVYGEPKSLPINEEHELCGRGVYAETKIEAEKLLEMLRPNFVGLRYMSVYGHAKQSGYRAVICKFFEQAMGGKPLTVYGKGMEEYDFIHVEDVVEANMRAMEKGKGFYNIGTGVGTRIIDLAEMVSEMTGVDIEFHRGPILVGRLIADAAKAERDLGFQAMIPLEEGLHNLYQEMTCAAPTK